MGDLVRWLGEQLDEDKRIAQAAIEAEFLMCGRWLARGPYGDDDRYGNIQSEQNEQIIEEDLLWPHVVHVAEWDPARILREIDAKRRIVRLHAITVEKADTTPFDPATGEPRPDEYDVTCSLCGWVSDDPASACLTLRLLALPYADRPGYREEWRL